MKVLILGGTQFFGKKLVQRLIDQQAEVTIVTRGIKPDPFGDAVKRIRVDRTDAAALSTALGGASFDVVYDNICYTPQEAREAIRIFSGRTGKYIVISSMSVYPFGEEALTELAFDPYTCQLPEPGASSSLSYADGKRLVEAVFMQEAPFPAAAVRFPIVLGPDDYTRRLHFHIENVQKGFPIIIPALDAKLSFINSDEAANFLIWLGKSELIGPVNACSHGEIRLNQLMSLIVECVGKCANIVEKASEEHQSPFGVPASWYMDTSKAEAAGFAFKHIDDWLPKLIGELANAKE
ncbi:Nucleoside-diphosphate-sugar epimerase [Paenibacillus algorifonticola]|uniref:Nucleoside-diphosphate-sugar epimerase n=1 Tax=Paenibacillus algorifonticola TaxID=684063 RepID=A0A1I2DHB5_9BACL|nr:NAD-dependent epimerase/dehydratase family protein [Paenibacillus algorifonticola]SFE79839.1 Nucleoside-diphosphate-sugar epimerase [Paenibacillus algorifonticola]